MLSQIVTEIRTLVHSGFLLAHPGVPLVFDNAPFDWNKPPKQFVTLEVRLYGGDQIGVSSTPRTRHSGFVYATTYAKEGVGSLGSLQVLETLSGLLGYSNAGPVRLQAPEVVSGASSPKGWDTTHLKVAFYADQS